MNAKRCLKRGILQHTKIGHWFAHPKPNHCDDSLRDVRGTRCTLLDHNVRIACLQDLQRGQRIELLVERQQAHQKWRYVALYTADGTFLGHHLESLVVPHLIGLVASLLLTHDIFLFGCEGFHRYFAWKHTWIIRCERARLCICIGRWWLTFLFIVDGTLWTMSTGFMWFVALLQSTRTMCLTIGTHFRAFTVTTNCDLFRTAEQHEILFCCVFQ